MLAANNSGVFLVIVSKFLIKLNLEASGIAILITSLLTSKGTIVFYFKNLKSINFSKSGDTE